MSLGKEPGKIGEHNSRAHRVTMTTLCTRAEEKQRKRKGAGHPATGYLEGQIIIDNLWVLEGRRFVLFGCFEPTNRFESQVKPVLKTL